jgi:hypothetical protein
MRPDEALAMFLAASLSRTTTGWLGGMFVEIFTRVACARPIVGIAAENSKPPALASTPRLVCFIINSSLDETHTIPADLRLVKLFVDKQVTSEAMLTA